MSAPWGPSGHMIQDAQPGLWLGPFYFGPHVRWATFHITQWMGRSSLPKCGSTVLPKFKQVLQALGFFLSSRKYTKERVSHSVVSDSLSTPWTVALQAPLSMEFSRQKYWSGLPFPSPGDIPNPGIEPRTPALQADALPSEPPGKPPRNYMLLLLSCFSCVRLCATPETAAHQAPPSLGFSRQEHWSELPFPSP